MIKAFPSPSCKTLFARAWIHALLSSMIAAASLCGQVAITTYHNDNSRTGANPNETILNTTNVNSSTFGKLFSRTVDGQIYAQPLYVPNVQIPGKGVHNVVYVVTMHDSVYAFDADSPALAAPLWQVSMGTSQLSSVCCEPRDIQPEIGILSTPVIDLSSGTLYLVAETYETGQAVFRLHALSLTNGADTIPPTVIQGSAPGMASDSVRGIVTFNPMKHWQRPGLLLMNGNIYIAFGGHQDTAPYHGWLFSYSASTLQQVGVLCLSPKAGQSGVWQGGVGLAGDASGNVYLESGNGAMNVNTGGLDYGDSLVKIGTASGLTILDYFSPSTQSADATNDWDFGSSGPVLIPGTSLGLAGGKDGKMYVFNTNNLGQYNSSADQIPQEWQATTTYSLGGAGGYWGGNFIYYNSTMYGFGEGDALKTFAFTGSRFNCGAVLCGHGSATATSQTSFSIPPGMSNDPGMSISANGTTGGTGIVWAAYSTVSGNQTGTPTPGILQAFDASNVPTELWNSNQNSARDSSGSYAKFSPPTAANGKVYLATFDKVLNVYGLLASASGGSLLGSADSSSGAENLTAEGTVDWVHWGDTSLNRKTGVPPQLSDYTAIGAGPVTPSSDDLRPLSWTDGAPTANSSNNTNGIYIAGTGQGFSLTAPADTTPRTLILHLGGHISSGTLTAHLSDASAPDYVDTTAVATGQYDRNYTLTYSAASAGQTLTITWIMASGTGDVTLEAAALQGETAVASAGTPQSATVNTAFATALQATVTSGGNPVSGATVTFTAPASGASGTFGGSATASVVTNASGVATAPTLTANGQIGSYSVTASVSGVAAPASFSLTNTAATTGGGSLQGSGTSATNAVNLTTEGTVDWVHWGDNTLNRKAGVTAQLSSYAVVGTGTVFTYNNDPRTSNWTDGTPTASSANNRDGIYINGVGRGFSFTAPADTTLRTLVVHVGGWNSGGTFTAHLSDGSAANFTDATATGNGQYDRNYALTYQAGSAGQTLTITWVMASGHGNVTLNGAALH